MIQLLFSHLLYDMQQQTHDLAEVRFQQHPELRDLAQADDSAHSTDLFLRFTEEACANLNTIFEKRMRPAQAGRHTPIVSSSTSTDALDYERRSWSFDLKDMPVPESSLAQLFHAFVVSYALWQWSRIYAPSEVSASAEAHRVTRKALTDIVYDLSTPSKHRRHPLPSVTVETT